MARPMTCRGGRRAPALILALIVAAAPGRGVAQKKPGGPPVESSSLGPMPGASQPAAEAPGGTESVLSGRPGPSVPRVGADVTRPSEFLPPTRAPDLGAVLEAPEPELPVYGPLALPEEAEAEGAAGGLTLDAAIARLIQCNLDLRSKALEIPQAQADILTAGLRANPILFYDTQFIPYGAFSDRRPGGPTQYDLNVTLPLDLNHKRRARVAYACRAGRVLEAQYQDAVRLTVGALSGAFVDVLAARETLRYARASAAGLDRLLADARKARQRGEATLADIEQLRIRRDAARIGVSEAEEALREARLALVPLLNLPPAQAEALEVRGSIAVSAPQIPADEALVRLALQARPDLAAYRLGIRAAEAGVRLAEAERLQDVFLLYQPYQFQDLAPYNKKSATSWAVGVTVPLPLFNRNQGNIRRARVNVVQTRTELARQEQLVATEVLQIAHRLATTQSAVARIRRDLIPAALRESDDARRRFLLGDADLGEFLDAQKEYTDLVRQYRDALVRRRRSMLELNTAVGLRLLP